MTAMRKTFQQKIVIVAMLLLLAASLMSTNVLTHAQSQKPVTFKAPDGFFPVEFSNHVGTFLLNPKKPVGMFVGYPSDGQDMAGFVKEMQDTAAKMFLGDAKNVSWTSASLPPHKGIDESGNLFGTSNDKMELQLAFYVRPEGVAYGYYGMRHKNGGGEDAKFLDATGTGVKAFDELAKSIGRNPKQ
jgi:hypothetical protein